MGTSVPCHHIREYRYAYGAVEPLTGETYIFTLFLNPSPIAVIS
ncbi:MAG: hypothetical protein ACI4M3_08885 [Acutalibacteraceae bacterium]